MVGSRNLERLNASDIFLLQWDDFGWSGDIGALAVLQADSLFDRDGRFRIEDVRRQVESRLHLVPRFRQRLYRPRLGLGWPLWVDSAYFDLADHVRVHPIAAPGDQTQLLETCQELACRRLDATRPLWELWLLPGLANRRVGAFLKLHHAIADGISGMAAFAALLDLSAEASNPVAPAWAPTPIPTAGELLRDNLHRRGQGLVRPLRGMAHPSRLLRRARRAWPAWRELLGEQRAPRTSLNRPIGAERRLAIVRSRLEDAKRVAHAYNVKVNDVVLAAVAGGLRQLLASRGEDVDTLTLRAMVPISLHQEQPGQASGNQDGWMIVPLPLGEPDTVRRLQLIAVETAERKGMARPPTGSGISGSLLFQRAFLRGFAHQRLMNTSVTNVPGPPVPLYLAGARLLEVVPVVSLMGNLTLVVAVLSYTGQLNLAAIADRDACPDVHMFTDGVQESLDDLARSVVVPSS
jgi:diacylglycerol O-acyltransferase / wax synthase